MARLQTLRLVLEPVTLDDSEFMLELLTDPAFIRHVGDRQVRTREQAAAYLGERVLPMQAEQGFGMFVVRLRDSGEATGICSLIQREWLADVDIGYAFLPRFRGMGLAFEATKSMLDWVTDELGRTRIVAIVTPDNERSIALLQKLGMVYESTVTSPGEDVALRLYAWTAADHRDSQ